MSSPPYPGLTAPMIGARLRLAAERAHALLFARLRTTKQALTPLLNDLERLGYLERRPAPGDGRGRVLWLTARGLAFVGAIKEILTGIEAEWSQLLGAERFATLQEALRELTEEPP